MREQRNNAILKNIVENSVDKHARSRLKAAFIKVYIWFS